MPHDNELERTQPVHVVDTGSPFDDPRKPEEGIALCLSGGGYRAMLFHLVLRQELERRLAQHGSTLEWADIIRDLDHLQETTIIVNEKDYVIRSQIKGTLGKVFQATGVAIPPAVRPA